MVASVLLTGSVVEFDDPRFGRRIARVSHERGDGWVVAYDPDGMRCILDPQKLTVIADHAEAGWGNLR